MNSTDGHTSVSMNWSRSFTDMHYHDNNGVSTADRAVVTVPPLPYAHDVQEFHYDLEIPLSPTYGISIWGKTQVVRAPTYSLAPSAMLWWWTRVRRLAHHFLIGEYGAGTMADNYDRAVLP